MTGKWLRRANGDKRDKSLLSPPSCPAPGTIPHHWQDTYSSLPSELTAVCLKFLLNTLTPSHPSTSFFPVCLGARGPGCGPQPRAPSGFPDAETCRGLPGPPGVEPARHVFSPRVRTQPAPVLPPLTRVTCFGRGEGPRGDCRLLSALPAFLAGFTPFLKSL